MTSASHASFRTRILPSPAAADDAAGAERNENDHDLNYLRREAFGLNREFVDVRLIDRDAAVGRASGRDERHAGARRVRQLKRDETAAAKIDRLKALLGND